MVDDLQEAAAQMGVQDGNHPAHANMQRIDRFIYGFLSICCFSIAVPALTKTVQLEVKLENAIQQNRMGTISADQIQGQLQSSQIAPFAIKDYHVTSISASKLDGQIQSSQISSLLISQLQGTIPLTKIDGTLNGQIQDSQIHSLSASKLFGSLQDSQLHSLSSSKLQGTLPVMLIPVLPLTKIDGTLNGQIQDSQIQLLSSSKLIGLLQDSQIQSLSSSKLGGSIQDSQIQSLSTAKLVGSLQDSQLQSLSASKLVGSIQDSQIQSLSSSKLVGSIQDSQIQSLTSSKLIGSIQDSQIQSLSASKLTGSIQDAHIQSNLSALDSRLSATQTLLLGVQSQANATQLIAEYHSRNITSLQADQTSVTRSLNYSSKCFVEVEGCVFEQNVPANGFVTLTAAAPIAYTFTGFYGASAQIQWHDANSGPQEPLIIINPTVQPSSSPTKFYFQRSELKVNEQVTLSASSAGSFVAHFSATRTFAPTV